MINVGNRQLHPEDLATHIRIVGRSGMGKSTLLFDILRQLALKRYGFALLDPHGKLYDQLLAYLAFVRYPPRDLFLLDATRRDVTSTINPFTAPPDLIENKAKVLRDLTLAAWGKDSSAVRADKILYILYVALLEQGRPLRDLFPMMHNKGVGLLRSYYARMEWERLTKHERVYDVSLDSVTTRLEPFSSEELWNLTDPERALDIPSILNGQILLANLKQGILEDMECKTLSSLLVGELWSAAFQGHLKQPFFLVIDEWTRMQSEKLGAILREAQKFKLHLIFLQQGPEVPSYLKEAVGNVSCFIQFVEKGRIQVSGWGSGSWEASTHRQDVPFVSQERIESYRALTKVEPRPNVPLEQPRPASQPSYPAIVAPEEGRGGERHTHLQDLIRDIGAKHGFKAEIEKAIEGASVDVSLERKGLKVACEVSVKSDINMEVRGAVLRLSQGYDHVALIVTDPKKLKALKVRTEPMEGVHAFDEAGLYGFLASLDRQEKGPFMDSEEAMRYHDVDLATLYRQAKKGEIPALKVGGRWRFPRKETEELYKAKTRVGEPTKATKKVARKHAKPQRKKGDSDDFEKLLGLR